MYDLKGHLNNIIEETVDITTGEALEKLKAIKKSHLSKDTLICSDFRKAVILIYIALEQTQPTSAITEVFRAAVEMCETLYAKPECRSRCQTLCLHNIEFLHSMLRREVFCNPQAVTRGNMFGRYFHAATYHAPLVNRIISPSSLYTELQERMFNKVKSITRTTSNYHPEDMITNILVRLQEELKQDSNKSLSCLQNAEGEVSKLGQALGEKENSYS